MKGQLKNLNAPSGGVKMASLDWTYLSFIVLRS
jgi:hypothetical protein